MSAPASSELVVRVRELATAILHAPATEAMLEAAARIEELEAEDERLRGMG